MLRKLKIALVAVLCLSLGAWKLGPTGAIVFNIPSTFLAVGGGGYIPYFDVWSSDGTLAHTTECARTDTYGAYCWDSSQSKWCNVVSQSAMPVEDIGYVPAPGTGTGSVSGTSLTITSFNTTFGQPTVPGVGQTVTGTGISGSPHIIGIPSTGAGTAGVYTLDASQSGSAGPNTYTFAGANGQLKRSWVQELVASPTQPNIGYLMYKHNIYRTTQLNTPCSMTWTKTTMKQAIFNASVVTNAGQSQLIVNYIVYGTLTAGMGMTIGAYDPHAGFPTNQAGGNAGQAQPVITTSCGANCWNLSELINTQTSINMVAASLWNTQASLYSNESGVGCGGDVSCISNFFNNRAGSGPYMAVDPVNANVLWICSPQNCYYTFDGGTNWFILSTSDVAKPRCTASNDCFVLNNIAFDRNTDSSNRIACNTIQATNPDSSPVTGTCTANIYMSNYQGIGSSLVKMSTAGGKTGTWVQVGAATFNNIHNLVPLNPCTSSTQTCPIYVSGNAQAPSGGAQFGSRYPGDTITGGSVVSPGGNSWTAFSFGGTGNMLSIDVQPSVSNPLCLIGTSGCNIVGGNSSKVSMSTDGGNTWNNCANYTISKVSGDATWQAAIGVNNSPSPATIKFDPTSTTQLLSPWGQGFFTTTFNGTAGSCTGGTYPNWISRILGIENYGPSNQVIVPTAWLPQVAQLDEGVMGTTSKNNGVNTNATPSQVPIVPGGGSLNTGFGQLKGGYAIDYGGTNPNFTAALVTNENSGYYDGSGITTTGNLGDMLPWNDWNTTITNNCGGGSSTCVTVDNTQAHCGANGPTTCYTIDLSHATTNASALTTWSAGSGDVVGMLCGKGASTLGSFPAGPAAMPLSDIQYYYPVTVIDSTHISLQYTVTTTSNNATEIALCNGWTLWRPTPPPYFTSWQSVITGTAQNGNDTQVTTAANHTCLTNTTWGGGTLFNVVGVQGTTNVNGTWIAGSCSGANITLKGSGTSAGAYTGGGVLLSAPPCCGGNVAVGTVTANNSTNLAAQNVVYTGNVPADYMVCTTTGAQSHPSSNSWKMVLPAMANGTTVAPAWTQITVNGASITLGTSSGSIKNAGSGGTNGTYTSVSLANSSGPGNGSGAVATVTISTVNSVNQVTSVNITSSGTAYSSNDVLTATVGGLTFTWSPSSFFIGTGDAGSMTPTSGSAMAGNGTAITSAASGAGETTSTMATKIASAISSNSNMVTAGITAYAIGNLVFIGSTQQGSYSAFYPTWAVANTNSVGLVVGSLSGNVSTGGWGSGFSIAADRVTPNTFYAYQTGLANNGGGTPSGGTAAALATGQGIWKFTNCGTPTLAIPGDGNWITNSGGGKLIAVDGEAGDFFMSQLNAAFSNVTHPANQGLFRNCDGASGYSAGPPVVPDMWRMPGFFEVRGVGFGGPKPPGRLGTAYPAIYVVGYYSPTNSVNDAIYGTYRSTDDPNHGVSGRCNVGGDVTASISGNQLSVTSFNNVGGEYLWQIGTGNKIIFAANGDVPNTTTVTGVVSNGNGPCSSGTPCIYSLNTSLSAGSERMVLSANTWTQLSNYPGGNEDGVNYLAADKNVFGSVYWSLASSGNSYGSYPLINGN